DADCPAPFGGTCLCGYGGAGGPSVNYCAGSNQALICAPLGYTTYSWTTGPGSPSISPSNATLNCLPIANPIPGSVYTLNLMSPSGCYYNTTYVLAPTQL